MTAKVAVVVLLLSTLALAVFAGCGNIAGDGPAPAVKPASEPPPAVATAVAQAEATVMAASAKSETDNCGRLCQPSFWLNASVADLDAELEQGADVNAKHWQSSPLHYAVLYADLSVIAALLDRGADIEARKAGGLTALHIIAGAGTDILLGTHQRHPQGADIVALLLERGADVNAQDGWCGCTPLHWANNPVVAALLLNYGADVNLQNDGGATPLHAAVSGGPTGSFLDNAVTMAAFLLEHGADIDAVAYDGQPPLFHAAKTAAQYRETDAVALLLEHGADIDATYAEGRTVCQSLEELSPSEIAVVGDLVCP